MITVETYTGGQRKVKAHSCSYKHSDIMLSCRQEFLRDLYKYLKHGYLKAIDNHLEVGYKGYGSYCPKPEDEETLLNLWNHTIGLPAMLYSGIANTTNSKVRVDPYEIRTPVFAFPIALLNNVAFFHMLLGNFRHCVAVIDPLYQEYLCPLFLEESTKILEDGDLEAAREIYDSIGPNIETMFGRKQKVVNRILTEKPIIKFDYSLPDNLILWEFVDDNSWDNYQKGQV